MAARTGTRQSSGSARSGTSSRSPFGRTTVITGPESLLADRALAGLRRQVQTEDPDAEIVEIEAFRLDAGKLAEMTGASLFSSRQAAVITDAAQFPAELVSDLVAIANSCLPDLAVIVVHGGGVKGKGLLDKLKAAKAEVITVTALKPYELPRFVAAEARSAGASIDPADAQTLIDAVGHDLRLLASAIAQLVADGQGGAITAEHIGRYFGGRSEVTSFAVADAVLSGRTGLAMEQLRWALDTGVAPVLLTSALASGLRGLGKLMSAPGGLPEADLAREVGVPPWKIKSMRVQARGWAPGGIASALTAVAIADADVKGAADNPDFALERAVLTISRARGT